MSAVSGESLPRGAHSHQRELKLKRLTDDYVVSSRNSLASARIETKDTCAFTSSEFGPRGAHSHQRELKLGRASATVVIVAPRSSLASARIETEIMFPHGSSTGAVASRSSLASARIETIYCIHCFFLFCYFEELTRISAN